VKESSAETIRAFVAAALPEDMQAKIGRLQQDLRPQRLNLRWVKPENIHLTIKFLGDIRADQVEPVQQVLAVAVRGCPALHLVARGIGVFPGPKRPRVMWVGLDGDIGPLTALARDIDTHLAAAGFAPEKRPFRAHLTIGRFRHGHPGVVESALQRHHECEAGTLTVEQVSLFRSQLRPDGPIYTEMALFPFAA
jgi:2'-5' RNA ligase